TSPRKITASTNSVTICASSRGTHCWSATAPATPTASPRREFRSHCSSCSSTSACADRSPTVASTTSQTPNNGLTAGSKPPTTAPTKPSKKSSISWPQPGPFAYHSAANTAAPKRNPTPPRRVGPSLLREKSLDSDLLKLAVDPNLDITPTELLHST